MNLLYRQAPSAGLRAGTQHEKAKFVILRFTKGDFPLIFFNWGSRVR